MSPLRNLQPLLPPIFYGQVPITHTTFYHDQTFQKHIVKKFFINSQIIFVNFNRSIIFLQYLAIHIKRLPVLFKVVAVATRHGCVPDGLGTPWR